MSLTHPMPRRLWRVLFELLVCASLTAASSLAQNAPIAPPSQKSAAATSAALKQRLNSKDRQEVFEKVWREIHDHYYDPSFNGVDWTEVRQRYAPLVARTENDQEFYALMSQVTSELHDAHTRFSSPEQWRNFRRQQSVTVGFTVDDVDGKTVITSVIPGTEAAHAGIEPGMVVLSVD